MESEINLPLEIKDNFIQYLTLDEVYSLCLSTQGRKDWLSRCNHGGFWRRIGNGRYPYLTDDLLQSQLISSLGKFYYDMAKFIYYLNHDIKENKIDSYVEISVEGFNLPSQDSRYYRFFSYLESGPLNANFRLVQTTSGSYFIDGDIDYQDESIIRQQPRVDYFIIVQHQEIVDFICSLFFYANDVTGSFMDDDTLSTLDQLREDFGKEIM